jgi:hypothetical protein
MPADVQITGPAVAVNDHNSKIKEQDRSGLSATRESANNNYFAFAEQSWTYGLTAYLSQLSSSYSNGRDLPYRLLSTPLWS